MHWWLGPGKTGRGEILRPDLGKAPLLFYLQKIVAKRLRDDVETEALAADWAEGQVLGIYGC